MAASKTGPSLAPILPGSPLPFSLQEGEQIYAEVVPEKTGFVLSRIVSSFVGFFVILLIGLVFAWTAVGLVLSLGLLVLAVFFSVAVALISYGKFKYWITNMRVIGQRGFIGHNVESIPLENITDVTLSRSMIEQILNLSSLLIVPIGGVVYRRGLGGSNYFPALKPDHAVELQGMLFKLREARKRDLARGL